MRVIARTVCGLSIRVFGKTVTNGHLVYALFSFRTSTSLYISKLLERNIPRVEPSSTLECRHRRLHRFPVESSFQNDLIGFFSYRARAMNIHNIYDNTYITRH